MPPKVLREFNKCQILFPHCVKNADCAVTSICQTNDVSTRPAELSLKRMNTFSRRIEMMVEEPCQNIHGSQRYHRDLF